MTLILTGFALEAASIAANQARRRAFDRKIASGYAGPVVIAEGDSWFCYPWESLLVSDDAPRDAVWQLAERRGFAVLDVAIPGSQTTQYVDSNRLPSLLTNLSFHKADVLLISGGGNDMVADGLLARILPAGDLPLERYLGRAFRDVVDSAIARLDRLARAALAEHPTLKLVFNGYAYAFPQPTGPWLGGPMSSIGIPIAKQKLITDKMIALYNSALSRLVGQLNREFGAVDPIAALAETLDCVPNRLDWFDELHPATSGFDAVAGAFQKAIQQLVPLVA